MRVSNRGPRYLLRWDHSRDQNVEGEVVISTHRLGELSFFSDEGLADLIDRYSREMATIWTMGDNPNYPSQREPRRWDGQSGMELLELIRQGRLQLTLGQLTRHCVKIEQTVDRLVAELVECQPGLRAIAGQASLLISSPSASQYFHFNTSPALLWHLRGRQRVWIYPARDPWVATGTIEEIVSGQRVDTIYYEPAFDDQAEMLDLEPGRMLALPQYTPYRIENCSGLNITLKTEYWTIQSLRRNNIHRANRMLKRFLPCQFDSARIGGVNAMIKRMLVNLVDLRIRLRGRCDDYPDWREQTFSAAANVRDDVRPLGPSKSKSINNTPIVPLVVETPASSVVAQEN